jgi:hypothetical protein
MHFKLESTVEQGWTWNLEQADGTVLATCPKSSRNEDDARKQIAAFRKSAGGVKFAKVLK